MTARTAPGPEDLSTPQTGRPPHTTAVDGGTAGATRIRPTGDRCPLPAAFDGCACRTAVLAATGPRKGRRLRGLTPRSARNDV